MYLPTVLNNLILDYFWSHKMYLRRVKVHREMYNNRIMREMVSFYSVFNTITVELLFEHSEHMINE